MDVFDFSNCILEFKKNNLKLYYIFSAIVSLPFFIEDVNTFCIVFKITLVCLVFCLLYSKMKQLFYKIYVLIFSLSVKSPKIVSLFRKIDCFIFNQD